MRFIAGHNMPRKHPLPEAPNPGGLCVCGCGQKTSIAKHTCQQYGHVKGQPVRFIVGHYARVQPRPSFTERFWQFVTPCSTDECWPWKGNTNKTGYGYMSVHDRNELSHRVSYELHNGPIPDGLWVLHRCDNPPCCNPYHLFLGTDADNVADMMAKGRHGYTGSRGESNAFAKLTEADVALIRALYSQGMERREIGEQFDVAQNTVNRVIRRESWRHVP